MIQTGQIDRAWELGPVTIPALRSLTRQAFDAVVTAVAELPGAWLAEPHYDYDGYLSILISPEDDSDAPSYLISGQAGQIELAQLQGDQLHTLGQFEHMEAMTPELVRALNPAAAR